jgi:glycosyltransferase involved in cell wall biosynthesis
MTAPLVSCVVPCFNGERYLDECIRSILAQTHRPLEIVVIDDGSTDGSADVVRQYPEVCYYHQDNAGPAAACASGVRLATGEFIAFLEQDDLWLPWKTSHQLAHFAADPALLYCVGHIQNFWVAELEREAERYRDHAVMQPVAGYVVQTLMVRRQVFDRVGPFNAMLRFAFASEWFLRAADAGAAGMLLPEVLTRRRLHQQNFSRLNRAESRDQFLHVVKAALDRRRGRTGQE